MFYKSNFAISQQLVTCEKDEPRIFSALRSQQQLELPPLFTKQKKKKEEEAENKILMI